VHEQSPEHRRQNGDRQEKHRSAGDPTLPVWRNAAARNEKMNVRIYAESLVMAGREQVREIRW
jgi:hypothetical protein